MISKKSNKLKSQSAVRRGAEILGLSALFFGVLMASGMIQGGLPAISAATDSVTESSMWVPGSFTELAERLSPTVVNIKVTRMVQAGGDHFAAPGAPFGDDLRRFFGNPRQGPPRRAEGAGSGVIISKDGYVITNNHVVEDAVEVTVTLSDQKEFPADVVGRDPKTDLAVLKIRSDAGLTSAHMGNSEVLKVGEWVLAIGNPFGLGHTVTSGIVSAKGRIIGAGPYDDFIQTDASINPGNSGGPLFNMRGELVGINTAIIAQGQGIGFAIPIDTVRPLVPQLISDSKVTRGYLGVSIQPVTESLAKALKSDSENGALVSQVTPDSPAALAGVRTGDVIVGWNGELLKRSSDLPALVATSPVGEKAVVSVDRGGEKIDLSVIVGELESTSSVAPSSAHPEGKWGLRLQNLDEQTAGMLGLREQRGVLVTNVKGDSPAARAGIRRGDLILEIDRSEVSSAREASKRIAESKGRSLLLLVQRGPGRHYVALIEE